jgi:hypothetical protein
MTDFLSVDTIHDLVQRAVNAGLASPVARPLLMAGINRQFVASIPMPPVASPAQQMQFDLIELNSVRLGNGEIPLERWLTNAVLASQDIDTQRAFRAALEDVAVQAGAAGDVVVAEGGVERVVHSDDLLPYEFLLGALATGAGVARVSVVRHENGVAVTSPGSQEPARSFGTGWLIGETLMVTNHHVIAARSESEAPPTDADLAAQALSIEIEFGADRPGVNGFVTGATEFAGHDVALDFALVRLQPPDGRAPLKLATADAVIAAANAKVPVNIVQHPSAGPKEVALRNNLIASFDDTDLRYFTDTLAGASGSPVCTDDWRVVALHKAWTRQTTAIEFQGKTTAWVNRGTRIDVIAAHLQANHPALWEEISTP